ncbi:hypothetical protein DCAR_0934217 [Daucus carota subsp. sativus]|uniref:Uncharacterized protein n=1 Tax=Daucus carota subsp. sativus TaxID=79200 RepID=A0A175YEZ7_DAUCS|nr:hypothetical protein DCAR_0934217 [Daucus carota subsp. sativus]
MHYLNATAGTCEERKGYICERIGSSYCNDDYLTGRFTANTKLAHYYRDNGLLLHIHRIMHAVVDRQKNHGIHFRVPAKALCIVDERSTTVTTSGLNTLYQHPI